MFSDRANFISEVSLKGDLPRGSYLKTVPAVRHLMREPLKLGRAVTVFAGENGSGKSTLIEGIAVAFGFNPEGGSLNYCFETEPTHSELYEYLKLSKGLRPRDGFFLRAESFYNAVSYIDRLDEIPAPAPKLAESYGGRSLRKMSHGEAFLRLVQNRFSGRGLYILDEPEAALSPMRCMTLLREICLLSGEGSQFIIATHSPILMALPGAEVLKITGSGIFVTDRHRTEHCAVMREFLNRPEKMLGELLK